MSWPRGAPHHFAEHEAARDGVIRELAPGSPDQRDLRQHLHELVGSRDADRGPSRRGGRIRDAGAMTEHVRDRDLGAGAVAELGQVLADAVVDVEHAAVVEQVHDHRRHRLRRRVDPERRVGRDAGASARAASRPARCPARGRSRDRSRSRRDAARRAASRDAARSDRASRRSARCARCRRARGRPSAAASRGRGR